jgi:deazaflavin-dependent oxidoreductase (nitroreductase family)
MPENAGEFQKPSAAELIFGRILMALVRIGLVRGHFCVLEVRGRKTGKTISLPVDPIDVGGRLYLVCARGNSQWVRNARAADEIALLRGLRRVRYTVHEMPPDARPPILKAYLDLYAREVQRFFPVKKGSAVDAFHGLAARYPVLELRPVDKPIPSPAEGPPNL